VAADLINNENDSRLGYKVFHNALNLGAFLRPLGNTLYWLPPFVTTDETLHELKAITHAAIEKNTSDIFFE
jgi:adenosylmethionine-8-amino-7-oxononanoate aminotransferase